MEFPSKHCKNLLILPHPENNYNEKLTGFSMRVDDFMTFVQV